MFRTAPESAGPRRLLEASGLGDHTIIFELKEVILREATQLHINRVAAKTPGAGAAASGQADENGAPQPTTSADRCLCGAVDDSSAHALTGRG